MYIIELMFLSGILFLLSIIIEAIRNELKYKDYGRIRRENFFKVIRKKHILIMIGLFIFYISLFIHFCFLKY